MLDTILFCLHQFRRLILDLLLCRPKKSISIFLFLFLLHWLQNRFQFVCISRAYNIKKEEITDCSLHICMVLYVCTPNTILYVFFFLSRFHTSSRYYFGYDYSGVLACLLSCVCVSVYLCIHRTASSAFQNWGVFFPLLVKWTVCVWLLFFRCVYAFTQQPKYLTELYWRRCICVCMRVFIWWF